MRKPDGQLNGVRVHRLKNKFGTKGLPTAELEIDGMEAYLVYKYIYIYIHINHKLTYFYLFIILFTFLSIQVGEVGRGVATIASILNITRLYAGLGVMSGLRRSLAIAKSYALKRQVKYHKYINIYIQIK